MGESTPLAQRLREVAHKADVEAHNRAILGVIGKRMSQDEKGTVVSWVRSSAVVVAVLRELANLHEETEPDDGMSPFQIRKLADSIEKGGQGG